MNQFNRDLENTAEKVDRGHLVQNRNKVSPSDTRMDRITFSVVFGGERAWRGSGRLQTRAPRRTFPDKVGFPPTFRKRPVGRG